jgi:MoaA/NifB/PqqE/SkfB family radical SAM enzyme
MRTLIYKLIARYYLRKPEMEDIIAARYKSWRSIWNTALNQIAFISRNTQLPRLTSLNIELTNCCNLRCKMCPTNNGMVRAKGYMDIELYKKIIDEAGSDLEFIQLYNWGEPLLHPDFLKFINYAEHKDIATIITTNGTLLTDENIFKIVTSCLGRIVISMDGLDSHYEKVRGYSYEQLSARVMKLIEKRNEINPNLKIDMNVVLDEDNDHCIEDFNSGWKQYVDVINYIPSMYLIDSKPEERQLRCPELWKGSLVVLWDGSVVPCCVDYEGKMVLGDAKTTPIKEIFNTRALRMLRRNHNRYRFDGICKYCVEYQSNKIKPRFAWKKLVKGI